MSTIDAKPSKVRILNTKLLPIAAMLLLVLALLFMATPLLRGSSGISARTGTNRQFTGTFVPRTGSGTPSAGGQNFIPPSGTGSQGQGFSGPGNTTTNGRTFANRPSNSLLRLSFLNGITGTIVYAILMLVALAAALGMFFIKRWGQVLGIVMGAIYLILALFSIIPMILLGFARAINGLNLGLTIVHIVLALAVIVLALISARKVKLPAETVPPSPASA